MLNMVIGLKCKLHVSICYSLDLLFLQAKHTSKACAKVSVGVVFEIFLNFLKLAIVTSRC